MMVGISAGLVMFNLTYKASGQEVRNHYEPAAQVELFSPEGIRVLIDVARPRLLTRPATENDVLLTSHWHFDHINGAFVDSFPGRQIKAKKDAIELKGVSIKGIVASHSQIPPT